MALVTVSDDETEDFRSKPRWSAGARAGPRQGQDVHPAIRGKRRTSRGEDNLTALTAWRQP